MDSELYAVIVQIIDDRLKFYGANQQQPEELIIGSFDGSAGTATTMGGRSVAITSSLPLEPGMRGVGIPIGPGKYAVVGTHV